ncbi:GDSL esterase/lipase At5g63170-like [Gastrolobium bilobum]|uniref:GDSL esterase/lipase At5g63170-like n=1 Tax=Gastrolobium bilobum TaxID=150636 RepID=UPI002AB1652B|nr:GDSL esterase/lipase At5g63170-like [Gastrolobium bilobum]
MEHVCWERLVTVVLVFFATRFPKAVDGAIPALFAFGDSILDTGNNNNLATLSKCNFPPYGRDFFGARPTGRWSNGRVPSDLIAEALGIKQTLPAYLNPFLSSQELATGVCFASGGSGLDTMTTTLQVGVLSMSAQMQLFKDYIRRLRSLVGYQRAAYIISNGLYLISAGNNDIAITYTVSPRRLMLFNLYADLLVGWHSNFVKELYQLGARHVWVLSTLPLGCLPGARNSVGGPLKFCVDIVNGQAQIYNVKLASAMASIRTRVPNFDLQFVDVYTPLLNIIRNPLAAGFVNAATGCCGTGTLEMAELCNIFIGSCPIPSAYVFWDAGHPTQRTYQLIVASILKRHRVSGYNVSGYNVSSSFDTTPSKFGSH